MRSGISAMENYEEIAHGYGISGTASSIVRIELSELLAALSQRDRLPHVAGLEARKSAAGCAA